MKKRIQILLITFFFFMMNCVVEFSNLSAVSSGTQNTSLFIPSMPIHSINEQAIEKIYGASGLKLSSDIVTQIKQTYSYIESIVKAIKIKNDPTLKSSFSKYYSSQKSSASILQDIMNSKEWSSVKVTNKEIQMSEFCQLYLKSMIVDYYYNQHDFIESISMVQNQMYPYLANIELNFYNNDFIKLRTFAELLRVEKILQDVVLQRYLAQSTDWKGKDPATLTANFTAFKVTDFYKYTHDKSLWSNSPNTMSHPLYEYIMGYFMLVTIQSTVQSKMTQNNLFSFLAQTSSSTISPNFFPYQSADVVAFDDIFTLQQASIIVPKRSSSHKDGSQKTFDMKDLVDVSKVKSYGNTQNVVIQKKGKDPTGISGHVKHEEDDVSKEATDDTKAIEKETNKDADQAVKNAADDAAVAKKAADDAKKAADKKVADEKASADRAAKKAADDAKKAADDAAAKKLADEQAAADKAAKKAVDDEAKQLVAAAQKQMKHMAKKSGEKSAQKDVQKAAQETAKQPVVQDLGNVSADLGQATVDVVVAGGQSAVGHTLIETGTVTGDQSLTQAGQQQDEQSKKDMAQATDKIESDAQQAADQLEKDTITKATDAAVKGLNQAGVDSQQLAEEEAKKTGEKTLQDSAQKSTETGISETEAAPITHQVESVKEQDFVTAGDQTAQFSDEVTRNKDFETAVSASEKGLADAPQEITKENAVADKEIAKENAVADKNIVKENTVADKNIDKENTVADKNIAKENAIADKNIVEANAVADTTIKAAGESAGGNILTSTASGLATTVAGAENLSGTILTEVGTDIAVTTGDQSVKDEGQKQKSQSKEDAAKIAQAAKNEGKKETTQSKEDADKAGLNKLNQQITTVVDTTGQGLETAGIATGQGLTTAGVATGQGLETAGVATGQGLETAGVATGQGLQDAATVTGTTLEYTAAAAGQGLAGAVLIGAGDAIATTTGDQTVKKEGEKQKAQAAQDAKKAGLDVAAQGITTAATTTGDTIEHASAAAGESLAGAVLIGTGSEIAAVTGDQTVKKEGEKQKAKAAQDANATGYKQFDANVQNAGQAAVKGTVDTGQVVVKGVADTGQVAVKGTVGTGQVAVKGVSDTGKVAVKGVADTGQAAVTGVTQTVQDIVSLGQDINTGATKFIDADKEFLSAGSMKKTTDDIGKSTKEGLKQTGKTTESDIVGSTNISDFVDVGTAAASAVTHGATAAVQGIAGGAALAVGSELGIKSVTQWGNKETALALQNAEQTDKAFNNTIANLAKFGLLGPIVYGVKGIVLGSVGLGATMLGDIVYAQTGNSSIKNWGTQQNNDAINNIKKTGDSINNIIASTALVLEDGIVAPLSLVLGAGVGVITQNKQMGQDLTLVLNQTLDSVINVGAVVFTSLVNLEDNLLVQIYKVGDSADELFVDAVMIAYSEVTNQKDVLSRSVAISSDTSKQLVKNMVGAITSTISCVMSSGMDVMMSVAQVLAAVENSLTTIVFDLVDEITYLGSSFGELMGAPINAKQERDKIDAKMEAHRGTINVVMSVVLMVAVTVATLGAAAPAAPAILAAEAGTAAMAETATVAVVETAATTAAATTAEAAATTAVSVVAETGTEATAALTAEATAETGVVATSNSSAVFNDTIIVDDSIQGTKVGVEQGVKTGTEQGAKKLTMTESIIGEENTATFSKFISENLEKLSEFASLYGADIIGQGINVVFSVFGIISQDNKDEAAITTLAQEKASIINLWQFIESNKVVMTQGQNIFLDELTKKHQSAIGNQTFGLNYYTNYLNSTINNMQSQISHALSQQYIQMLTPDDTGSKIADIGSSWGLATPFVYLYPSQGFLTTTLGRKNFPYAQEIAQAPLVAQSATSSSATKSLDSSSAQPSALWFNQRAVSIVDQAVDAPLNVEIKFRVIYNLSTEFHVGLYLGGKYYDYNSQEYLADIKNNGGIHLDDAHLAKMFVLKRDNGDKKPSIGVYENEGKGWILNKPLDNPSFNHAAICHMSATLHKNKLTVSVWTEDKPTSVWTNTVDVTPCDQKTFGLIFSGAAIEWDVVKPAKVIQQNAQVRTPITTPLEGDRERVARKAWAQLRNPDFGAIKLASLGKKYLFQGQYVYSTNNTPLKDKNGTQLTDIVAFATFVAGSCTNIGSTPTPADTSTTPNAIISMINGDIYNAKGVVLGNQKDPWTLFTQSNGPFDQGLMDTVIKTQQACPPKPVAVSTQTISFDSFDVGDAPSVGGFEFGLSAPTDLGGSDESFGSLQLGAADGFSFDFGDFGDSF